MFVKENRHRKKTKNKRKQNKKPKCEVFVAMAESQSERGNLSVILAECLTLLFQLMVVSYVDSLSCGISFLWFKRVLEGEQYDAKVVG